MYVTDTLFTKILTIEMIFQNTLYQYTGKQVWFLGTEERNMWEILLMQSQNWLSRHCVIWPLQITAESWAIVSQVFFRLFSRDPGYLPSKIK